MATRTLQVVSFLIGLCLFAFPPVISANQQSTAESIAFEAVSQATNAAAALAAAEELVARFPQSGKRPIVAQLVSEQLKTIRNPEVAITLVERARAIFTAPEELNSLQPVAFEIYANGNRIEQALGVAADLLERKPYEFWILARIVNLAVREARKKELSHADVSLEYAARAIAIIENERRSSELSDSEWNIQKAQLPKLYQQIGIIKLAQGKTSEAKAYVLKATQSDPRDPAGFGLLARILDSEYTQFKTTYESTVDLATREQLKTKLAAALDQLIETYARAAGLATGRSEYLELLQQIIPDLARHYRSRHNDTAGLQRLIEKYR